MARATWSGFLSFGLVSVPVGLFSATSDQTIHFNQLHKNTSHRVRYKKVDEETGEELSTEDIVNGYPLGGGEYVVVTKEEMADAAPGKSELIEIQDFVDLEEIDPIFFRQSYYLAPKGKGADRAYALLLQAMLETKKVGIATLVLRDKEHLVAIRPAEKVLMLETMFFEDEIRRSRRRARHLAARRQRERPRTFDREETGRVPDRRVGPESLQEHVPPAGRRAHRRKARRSRRRPRRRGTPEVERHRPDVGPAGVDRSFDEASGSIGREGERRSRRARAQGLGAP